MDLHTATYDALADYCAEREAQIARLRYVLATDGESTAPLTTAEELRIQGDLDLYSHQLTIVRRELVRRYTS